jgi:hypothetical protein
MTILLLGAVACIIALIASAWLMTFTHWLPLKAVEKFSFDYKSMIRAHVDYALMAVFNLAFYGVGIELPTFICLCIAVGGFTNPAVFVIAAFDQDFWSKPKWKIFTLVSFIMTTLGFCGASLTYLIHAL